MFSNQKRSLVALALMLGALGLPVAVDAQGIAYTMRGSLLQRHSLVTGNTSSVGDVGAEVVALSFSPGDDLYGMTANGQLVGIDAATGAGAAMGNPLDGSGLTVSDVAFGPGGALFVVGTAGGDTELHQVDVAGGTSTLVGTLDVPVTAIGFRNGTLLGVADFQLYSISTADGSTTLASDAFFVDALAADFSASGNLWVLSTAGGTPPIDFVVGFETEGGTEVAPPFEIPSPARGLAVEPAGTCVQTATEMCLLGRFRAEVTWRDFQGNTGSGIVVPEESNRSGIFAFFNPDNWEMLIKVLDGCSVNDHFWVFAAQATNVEYTLVVTDTVTQEFVTYLNPLGTSPLPVTDTAAFMTCP